MNTGKFMGLLLLGILTVASLFIVVTFAFADGWEIETVTDNTYNISIDIALDSDNNPYIVGGRSSSVIYLYKVDGEWVEETVGINPESNIALAVDTENNPHLTSGYEYAYRDNSGWYVEAVPSTYTWHENPVDIGSYSYSIDIDPDNNPHITFAWHFVYYEGPRLERWDFAIEYPRKTGDQWQLETIVGYYDYAGDWPERMASTSLGVDNSGATHLAFTEFVSDNGLNYYYYYGGQSDTMFIDGKGSIYKRSVVTDSEDRPHIIYIRYADKYGHSIAHASYDGISWSKSIVVESDSAYEPDADIDSTDIIHITYNDYDTNRIMYVYGDGFSWQSNDLNSTGNSPAIAVDDSGLPHIAYRNGGTIRYAFWATDPMPFSLISPPNESEVQIPVTLDWEDSSSDAGPVSYDIRYSTESDFSTYDDITGLTESTYKFPEGVLEPGETYFWKVRAYDGSDERWCRENYWSFTVETEQGIDDGDNSPKVFSLGAATPNPSSGNVAISFALPRACEVNLEVFDIKGRKVTTAAKGEYAPGEHQTGVNGLAGGIYLYRLTAGEFADTKKMVVR
ncbi:MAG: T9SS type A sorting domain-containing protein [bacterium]|nr:T9SS type A sorting domain-containing protein [bacterium]